MSDAPKLDPYTDARKMLTSWDGTLWDFPCDETTVASIHAVATLALVDAVRELNRTLKDVRDSLPGWGS